MPMPAKCRQVSSSDRGTRSMKPNRRASLYVTVAPLETWNTTWSWALSPPCSRWNSPGMELLPSFLTRKRPDMPRCMTSTSPDDRSATRYLARRPRDVTVRFSSRAAKRSGKGKRRSGRRCSTRAKLAPTSAASRPRRTVSTSGSSGIDRLAAWSLEIANPGRFRYGSRQKVPLHFLVIGAEGSRHDGRHHPFRLRDRPARRETEPRERGVPFRRAPLRPDERPHVGGTASALEGHAGHGGPSVQDPPVPASRRRWRDRRRGVSHP